MERLKSHEKSVSYVSNDAFVWTTQNPDLELVEPPILASINSNYLCFGRNVNRPPERRQVIVCNHGDFPLAYKIMTTDNYSYFVDQVFGVIPASRLQGHPFVRCQPMVTIHVNCRPLSCYPDEQQGKHYNTPRKDKLFILLAPYMNSSFTPEAIFHNERCYEKLRVLLNFTGRPPDPDNRSKSFLIRSVRGWATWEVQERGDRCDGMHKLKGILEKQQRKLKDSRDKTPKNSPRKTPTKVRGEKSRSKAERASKKDQKPSNKQESQKNAGQGASKKDQKPSNKQGSQKNAGQGSDPKTVSARPPTPEFTQTMNSLVEAKTQSDSQSQSPFNANS
ncbi:unnamed protein product [Caenorhabditis auriculariae]|uniref:Major sperm protein n=1 Tax=Caenorhabditis auriculariae TaxID=2777116 RepID=A0A8S1HEJ2_9PELO|nr:unnamed protein product [Caenorhabditis auriculariae]